MLVLPSIAISTTDAPTEGGYCRSDWQTWRGSAAMLSNSRG